MIHHFVAEETYGSKLNFDISLEKDKQVYCFIGENGCGKTQLLENMTKSCIFASTIFKNNVTTRFKQLFNHSKVYEQTKDLTIDLPKTIKANAYDIKKKTAWDTIDFRLIIPEYTNMIDAPFLFIGAKNRGYTKNINKNQIKLLGDKEDIFIDVLIRTHQNSQQILDTMEDISLANWIVTRSLINSDFIENNENRDFEVEALLELMELLDPKIKSLLKQKENRLKTFTFKEDKLYFAGIPLDKLSTGFVSILKIFQEIIAGYGAWLGMIGETDIRNAEGVVFIDEIESHLHAKWQYKIIPLLKEFFPKTTFYIATHSPLIVSTTDEDESYELVRKGNHVSAKKLGNPKNWYLADVFSQAFHVNFNDKAFESQNGEMSLTDLLKSFSEKVKTYTVEKEDDLKTEIESLYQEILPNLGEDDPRRRSLDSLKSLVS